MYYLFIMSPHANDFDGVVFFNNLIDKSVLNINTPGICSMQITDEFFIGWRSFKGIAFKNFEKFKDFWFQSCGCNLFGVLLSLSGIDEFPFHQSSSVEHFSTGVLRPRTIDFRIPGTERRYNVSSIARQSSSEMRTAELFFPIILIGSCDFSDSSRSSFIFAFLASIVFIVF